MADITSNLVGWWTFDESSGTATDMSGNGNTGTLTGGPPVRKPGSLIGNSLLFNGTSDYVNIPANSSIGNLTSSFTLATWVRMNDMTFTPATIWATAESPSSSIGFTLKISDSAGVITFTTNGVFDYLFNLSTMTAKTWTHVAIVLDSAFDATLYLQGVSRQLVAQTAAGNANTTQATFIGAAADNTSTPIRHWFTGEMDDFRLYNRALTAADIALLYPYTGVFPKNSLAAFPKTKMSASPQGRVI